MKVINIPKLGTVIWDNALEYPKLLKQIVELESTIESKNNRISGLFSTLSTRETNNIDLHNKNIILYENNKKLNSQLMLAKAEIKLLWLVLMGVFILNLIVNIVH